MTTQLVKQSGRLFDWHIGCISKHGFNRKRVGKNFNPLIYNGIPVSVGLENRFIYFKRSATGRLREFCVWIFLHIAD